MAVGLDGIEEPVDVVLDTVGGRSWSPPGGCSLKGATSRASVGPPGGRPSSRRIRPSAHHQDHLLFLNQGDAGDELSTLVHGQPEAQRVDIGWRGPLKEFAEAVDMLEGRRLNGKAVLTSTRMTRKSLRQRFFWVLKHTLNAADNAAGAKRSRALLLAIRHIGRKSGRTYEHRSFSPKCRRDSWPSSRMATRWTGIRNIVAAGVRRHPPREAVPRQPHRAVQRRSRAAMPTPPHSDRYYEPPHVRNSAFSAPITAHGRLGAQRRRDLAHDQLEAPPVIKGVYAASRKSRAPSSRNRSSRSTHCSGVTKRKFDSSIRSFGASSRRRALRRLRPRPGSRGR